jgi:hypothetical protein
LGSRSRRGGVANRKNIFNILRIGCLAPTQILSSRGGFETASIHVSVIVESRGLLVLVQEGKPGS